MNGTQLQQENRFTGTSQCFNIRGPTVTIIKLKGRTWLRRLGEIVCRATPSTCSHNWSQTTLQVVTRSVTEFNFFSIWQYLHILYRLSVPTAQMENLKYSKIHKFKLEWFWILEHFGAFWLGICLTSIFLFTCMCFWGHYWICHFEVICSFRNIYFMWGSCLFVFQNEGEI